LIAEFNHSKKIQSVSACLALYSTGARETKQMRLNYMQRVHLILLAKLINIAVSFLLEHYFGSPRQTFPRIWTVLCGADMHNAMSIKGEGGGGACHMWCGIACTACALSTAVV
jgi:hypothetical protein